MALLYKSDYYYYYHYYVMMGNYRTGTYLELSVRRVEPGLMQGWIAGKTPVLLDKN